MATESQARDVEIERALDEIRRERARFYIDLERASVEIRQRQQQMDSYNVETDRTQTEIRQRLQEMDSHPVNIRQIVRQANAEVGIAVASGALAGAAIATFFFTYFGVRPHP